MSITLDDVATLIERWRDARGLSKAKVATDATALLRSLSPDQQRGLAIEVFERVAPQLTGRVAAESGSLSSGQITALVNLISKASRDDLTGLVDALRTGEVGPALALASQAAEIAAPEMHERAVDALDGIDGELDGRVGTSIGDAADAREAAAEERRARRLRLRQEAEAEAAARADRWRSTASTSARVVVDVDVPTMDFDFDISSLPAVTSLPTPVSRVAPPAPSVPGWAGRDRRDATTRELRDDSPWALIPDGWRRRRAVMAAIEDGDHARDEILDGIASLGRASDRLWVCKSLVDRYGISPDVFVNLLDDRGMQTIERMAARV